MGKPKADVPEFLRERYNWFASDDFPESKGIVLCSLVKEVKTNCPELRRYGNVIVVPQFGKIYVAELQLQRDRRELAMLRVEMGSTVGGSGGGPGGTGGGYNVSPELAACFDRGNWILRMQRADAMSDPPTSFGVFDWNSSTANMRVRLTIRTMRIMRIPSAIRSGLGVFVCWKPKCWFRGD